MIGRWLKLRLRALDLVPLATVSLHTVLADRDALPPEGTLVIDRLFRRRAATRAVVPALFLTIAAVPGYAQCGGLVAPSTNWTAGAAEWLTGSNWSGASAPGAATNACVLNGGTANLDGAGVAASLQTGTGSPMNTSGAVNINNGSTLTLSGNQIVNFGSITLNALGNGASLVLAPTNTNPVTLLGSGTLSMSGNSGNRIYGGGNTPTLVNSSTIQGAGQIGLSGSNALTIDNASLINADLNNQTLQLITASGGANSGILEASAGGTLHLLGAYANTGGTIEALASGVVNLTGSTITGGTLKTFAGTVQNIGTAGLSGVTIGSGSVLTLGDSSATTVSGTFTNNGLIALNSAGNATDVIISGAATLTSSGSLQLTNNVNNRIYGVSGGANSLLNDTNHTIEGAGQIGINNSANAFSLTNKGVINADKSAGLTIAPTSTVVNTGTMEATNGATLTLIGAYTNTGGLISVSGAGSAVSFDGAAINGGTLTGTSGGAMQTTGNNSFNGVALSAGTLTLGSGSVSTLAGTITNNGVIGETGPVQAFVSLSGAVTLTGSGSFAFTNNPNNEILGTSGSSLLNDTNHTISGAGSIGNNSTSYQFALTNQGTIKANQENETLELAPLQDVTNTGTLEATAGAILHLTGGNFNSSGAGAILATGIGSETHAASTVELSGSTINGGLLTTSQGGVIQNSGVATLNGVTITSGSTVSTANFGGSATTDFMGTITNNGTILAAAGGTVELKGSTIDGGNLAGTIQNTGTATLNAVTITSGSAVTLGHGSGTTLEGVITNDGSVAASGVVGISGTVTLNGTGSLNLSGGSIAGSGTLINGAGHTIHGGGDDLANLTNNGTVISGTMHVYGNVTNNGTLQASSGGFLTLYGSLTNYSNGTLTGGTYNAFGQILITQLGSSGGEITANAATILLDGGGSITDSSFDALHDLAGNTGSLTIQNGHELITFAPSFTNSGFVDIGSGSTFLAHVEDYIQADGTTRDDGTLTAPLVSVSGGLFEGTGVVNSALTVTGGTVKPGDSPGTLTVDGTYIQDTGGTLEIDIADIINYDFLDLVGEANFGGTLELVSANGFTAQYGDEFFIAEYGSRNGTFADVDTSGLDLQPGLFAEVLYDQGAQNNEVEVLITTPEPSTLYLAGSFGLLAVLRRIRRRSR